jgi:hypothetical protein
MIKKIVTAENARAKRVLNQFGQTALTDEGCQNLIAYVAKFCDDSAENLGLKVEEEELCIGAEQECNKPVSGYCPDGELCQWHLDAHVDKLILDVIEASHELDRYRRAKK